MNKLANSVYCLVNIVPNILIFVISVLLMLHWDEIHYKIEPCYWLICSSMTNIIYIIVFGVCIIYNKNTSRQMYFMGFLTFIYIGMQLSLNIVGILYVNDLDNKINNLVIMIGYCYSSLSGLTS